MKNQEHDIDNLLRDTLRDVRHTPPADVWQDLDRKLPRKERRKIPFLFWKWVVGCLLAGICIVTGVGWNYRHTTFSTLPITASTSLLHQENVPLPTLSYAPQNMMKKVPQNVSALSKHVHKSTNRGKTIVSLRTISQGQKKIPAIIPYQGQLRPDAMPVHEPVSAIAENNAASSTSPEIVALAALSPSAKPESFTALPAADEPAINILEPGEKEVAIPANEEEEEVPATAHKENFRFPETSIQAGYAYGLSTTTVQKFALGIQLSVPLAPRISLSLAPAFLTGAVNNSPAPEGNYYRINSVRRDLVTYTDPLTGHTVRNTVTQQHFDSITVRYRFSSRQLWEVSVPLLFNYQLSRNWQLYAGPSVTFGNRIKVIEQRSTIANVGAYDTIPGPTIINPPDLNSLFHHPGQPVDSLRPVPEEPVPTVRIGYQAGVSYQYGLWLATLSVQQQLTGAGNIINPVLKQIYYQPYLRLMIGYMLHSRRYGRRAAKL